MEGARDLANQMSEDGKGLQLNQFANQDNPNAHVSSTGKEIWKDLRNQLKLKTSLLMVETFIML